VTMKKLLYSKCIFLMGLLTCCVCFVQHMMISIQVRYHTHFDLTTWRVCFVKQMMIMRQYFPQLWYDPYPLHACGLGLCLYFSALVCNLLPRRLFDGFCWRCIARRVSQSRFWRAMLGRTLGLFDAFRTLVGGHHWSLGTTFLVS